MLSIISGISEWPNTSHPLRAIKTALSGSLSPKPEERRKQKSNQPQSQCHAKNVGQGKEEEIQSMREAEKL